MTTRAGPDDNSSSYSTDCESWQSGYTNRYLTYGHESGDAELLLIICLIIADHTLRNGRLVLLEIGSLGGGGEVVRYHHHRIRTPVLELSGHVDRVAALLVM